MRNSFRKYSGLFKRPYLVQTSSRESTQDNTINPSLSSSRLKQYKANSPEKDAIIERPRVEIKRLSLRFAKKKTMISDKSAFSLESSSRKPRQTQSSQLNKPRKQFNNQLNGSRYLSNSQFDILMRQMPILDYNKIQKNKLSYFVQCLPKYFKNCPKSELIQALPQLKLLKAHLYDALYSLKLFIDKQRVLIGRQFINSFSKIIFHLCQTVLTEKYSLQFNQLSINRDIQYFSRRLHFFPLVLKTCLDIGQTFCQQKQYQEGSEYFLKAMKLAVVMNDKYTEQLAIDKMGLCQYYSGNISKAHYYHQNRGKLPPYQQQLIKDQYSNQKEIQKLFEDKHIISKLSPSTQRQQQKRSSIMGRDRNRERDEQLNFVQKCDPDYPFSNFMQLKKELYDMSHVLEFHKSVKLIKRKMDITTRIGQKRNIGKFFAPKASKYRVQNSFTNEIMLTHRSFNRGDDDLCKKVIYKESKFLAELLTWFTDYGLQNIIQLKQESQ